MYGEKYTDIILATAMYDAHDRGSIKKGSDAFFVLVDEFVGVKSFYNRYTAIFNQNMQYLASLHGIAPRCQPEIFHLMAPNNGREVFSFVTDIADTSAFEDGPNVLEDEYWDFVEIFEQSSEYRELTRKMRHAGFGAAVHDLHPGNVGYYEGKLVCIDFSRMEAAGFRSRNMVR